jgi:hypothetical protein
MTCSYQSQPTGKDTGRRLCAIGLYGGKPFLGNCKLCIDNNRNNAEYATELIERVQRSHPSNKQKISGCCDRADQE